MQILNFSFRYARNLIFFTSLHGKEFASSTQKFKPCAFEVPNGAGRMAERYAHSPLTNPSNLGLNSDSAKKTVIPVFHREGD